MKQCLHEWDRSLYVLHVQNLIIHYVRSSLSWAALWLEGHKINRIQQWLIKFHIVIHISWALLSKLVNMYKCVDFQSIPWKINNEMQSKQERLWSINLVYSNVHLVAHVWSENQAYIRVIVHLFDNTWWTFLETMVGTSYTRFEKRYMFCCPFFYRGRSFSSISSFLRHLGVRPFYAQTRTQTQEQDQTRGQIPGQIQDQTQDQTQVPPPTLIQARLSPRTTVMPWVARACCPM